MLNREEGDSRRYPGMRSALQLCAMMLLTLACSRVTFAWIYPEHRDIAIVAIQSLDPERRAVLDQLWAWARVGHEGRLCAVPADATSMK